MIIIRSVLSFTGTPNNGSLPIGNGQGFTINTLTAGTNITITNGPGTITIDAAGGGGSPAGSTNEIQFNNAGTFAASANLRWIISDNRLVLGTENTPDTNSRMVVIGKGISTQNTFVVHNQTGTNNALVVRDDGRISFNSLPTGGFLGDYKFKGLGNSADLYFINSSTDIFQIRSQRFNGTFDIEKILELTGSQVRLFVQGNGLTVRVAGNNSGTETVLSGNLFNNGTNNRLILRNTSNLHGTMRILFQKQNQDFGFIAGRSNNIGTDNFITIGVQNASQTSLNEVIRFIGTGNVLIGTTTDVASSILTLESTTKGFLPPRNADPATNIATPVEGLIAFDTTDKKLQVFDGTNWIDLH